MERWSISRPTMLDTAVVAGDRIVLPSFDAGTWIVDGDGRELGKVPTKADVDAIAAFEDGIAVSVRDAFAVSWWRPGAELVELSHDEAPDILRSVPAGLLSTDGKALCLWSSREQGPELAPVEC